MPIHQWWSQRDRENFWLEVTDRIDIGANLKAPQTDEGGKEFWGYSLLNFVSPNDVVFHYDKNVRAIMAKSITTGELWKDSITWAARGASAREAGIEPHPRAGWYLGLENYEVLPTPLELGVIRNFQNEILKLKEQLIRSVDDPIYFPFAFSELRDVRPLQGYLFKLPLFFVELFSENLLNVIHNQIADIPDIDPLGSEYRIADDERSVGMLDPFSRDPALVERGLNGHARTQNRLAEFLREISLIPLSPNSNDPNFDIAWTNARGIWVAEIKSLTDANEEKQLRLGLGQIIRYCHILGTRGAVHGVLVLERAPSDISWEGLCSEHNIILVWPEVWEQRLGS